MRSDSLSKRYGFMGDKIQKAIAVLPFRTETKIDLVFASPKERENGDSGNENQSKKTRLLCSTRMI